MAPSLQKPFTDRMGRKRKGSKRDDTPAAPPAPRYTPTVAVHDVVSFLQSKGHDTAALDVEAEFGPRAPRPEAPEAPPVPDVTESDGTPESPTVARPRGMSRKALTLPTRPCGLIRAYVAFTNASLRAAVAEYFEDKAATEHRYGKMNTWDVGRVTDMSRLFRNWTGLPVSWSRLI